MAGKFMRSNHDPNNILVTGADIDIDIKALLLSSHILPPSSHQHHHHLQSLRNYLGVSEEIASSHWSVKREEQS